MRDQNLTCRICLKSIKRKNESCLSEPVHSDIFKEILNSEAIEVKHLNFCDKCSISLETAFAFKAECTLAEEIIFPYLTSTSEELSLAEIYCKINNVNTNDLKICRICLKDCKQCDPFNIPLENIENHNILEKYLPDLVKTNLRDTNICHPCSAGLNWFISFLKDVLNTENNKNNSEKIEEVLVNKKSGMDNLFIKIERTIIDEKTDMKNILEKIEKSDVITTSKKSCPFCPYNGSHIREHILVHQEVKLFKCDICDKAFSHRRSMQHHKKVLHLKTKILQCTKCIYTTTHKAYLIQHEKTKHAVNTDTVKCKFCSVVINKRYLLKHIKSHHTDKSNLIKYYCKLCSYSTISKSHLKRHDDMHKDISEVKTHKCTLCTYECREKSNLKHHMQKHKKIKSIKCSLCDFKTKHSHSLTSHLKSMHGGCKMYDCSKCSFSSKLKSNLTAHIKYVHDKNYVINVCNICGLKTNRKGTLVRHMLTHSDEFEFQCKDCNFQTQYKKSIIRHTKVFHDKEWN